jgi:hypothetical protein
MLNAFSIFKNKMATYNVLPIYFHIFSRRVLSKWNLPEFIVHTLLITNHMRCPSLTPPPPYVNPWMLPPSPDHISFMITLTTITLSGFHCCIIQFKNICIFSPDRMLHNRHKVCEVGRAEASSLPQVVSWFHSSRGELSCNNWSDKINCLTIEVTYFVHYFATTYICAYIELFSTKSHLLQSDF